MLIFELLDQYEGICRRAFFGCAAKLSKTFKTNIIEILILIMCIPRKINFLQLGRYGRRGEQRYRQTFRKDETTQEYCSTRAHGLMSRLSNMFRYCADEEISDIGECYSRAIEEEPDK